MSTRPVNPAEALIHWTLKATWPFYFIGALFVVGPVLAWTLAGLAALSIYLGPAIRSDLRSNGPLPSVVWAWGIGMLVMLASLWIAHFDWNLGAVQTIKSTVGWAKGWAMLALFPFAGAILPIRRESIVRAQCKVGLWTLVLLPILIAAPMLGLPEKIFTSPLKVIGGPGPEYFSVYLYTLDPSSWEPRWQFYAPWSPFAGLLGVVMVLFALEDRRRFWMVVGVSAGVAMILLSKSRMGMVALVVCVSVPMLLPLILRSWAWKLASVFMVSMAAFGTPLLRMGEDAVAAFRGARADSSRVRETLQRIAKDRWENEAVWFGHGTVEPGPHIVEYMPIGSHHTWFGLLFVKGAVGFLALLVPMAWQFGLAIKDCAYNRRGRLPLGLMLVFLILSFGENIEIEAYLLWPALLVLGIHAREVNQDKIAE